MYISGDKWRLLTYTYNLKGPDSNQKCCPPFFVKIMKSFTLMQNTQKKGLNRGGEIVGAFCFKNAFLADIGYYHNVIF